MSTGISEIGSHPKDVERLKHHILWMLVACAKDNGDRFQPCIVPVYKHILLVAKQCAPRLLCRSRLNASDIGGGPIP